MDSRGVQSKCAVTPSDVPKTFPSFPGGITGSRRSLEAFDFTRLAQHLVHFSKMHLFLENHPAGILFEKHRTVPNQVQQVLVKCETLLFSFKGFDQDVIDAMLLRFQQRPYFQARMFAKMGYHFAGLVGMCQAGSSFTAQPTNDGDAAMPKNHQRVMRVTHNSSQFCLENFV